MVFTRLVAMSGYQMGEVVPVVLGIAYTISQVPSYIFPKELIERVHKMRDANGEEVTLTLKMNQAFDRELCESGVENTSIIDVQVRVHCAFFEIVKFIPSALSLSVKLTC